MYSGFLQILAPDRVKFNEPMKNHTTFKIGGTVDVMVTPLLAEELIQILRYCHEKKIPFFVFGLGSNLLVKDNGYRGIAIKMGEGLKTIQIKHNRITAEAGVRLSNLAKVAAREGLSGLEFAEGIPGSLGGAVIMNAGAYGGEIKDILESVVAVDYDGVIKRYSAAEMNMGYRSSVFQDSRYIVLSASLQLKPCSPPEVLAKMDNYASRRREKQPLGFPSAGSVFKRPEGLYVGPMLEELGLKGYRIGDAEISTKHAGFIINKGEATARDVLALIEYINNAVYARHGITLQTEIKVIGE